MYFGNWPWYKWVSGLSGIRYLMDSPVGNRENRPCKIGNKKKFPLKHTASCLTNFWHILEGSTIHAIKKQPSFCFNRILVYANSTLQEKWLQHFSVIIITRDKAVSVTSFSFRRRFNVRACFLTLCLVYTCTDTEKDCPNNGANNTLY